MLGTGKCAAANIRRISGDGGFNGGPEIAIATHEFRHSGGEPQHVLEHEDLGMMGTLKVV